MQATAWRENMFQYLSANLSVTRSEKLLVMDSDPAKDKFPNTFLKANGGYCIYYPLNIFRYTRDLKIGEHHSDTQDEISRIRKRKRGRNV